MKRSHWLIFGAIQLLGALAAVEAVFLQEAFLLGASFLLLLPGTLALFALNGHAGFLFTPGVGSNWPLWTLCVIAIFVNMILFAIASFLLVRYRKRN
jgi:hypothetical protein